MAMTSGTAVIHLPPDPAKDARLLWSAFFREWDVLLVSHGIAPEG